MASPMNSGLLKGKLRRLTAAQTYPVSPLNGCQRDIRIDYKFIGSLILFIFLVLSLSILAIPF